MFTDSVSNFMEATLTLKFNPIRILTVLWFQSTNVTFNLQLTTTDITNNILGTTFSNCTVRLVY